MITNERVLENIEFSADVAIEALQSIKRAAKEDKRIEESYFNYELALARESINDMKAFKEAMEVWEKH